MTFEPRNISAALDLLNELFTFSGLEDEEVTKLSRQIAEKSESLMLQARSLQIRSLLSAERHSEAPKIAEDILAHYPNSEEIYEALKLSVFDEEYRK